MPKENEIIESYKQAVWDFILEHSEMLNSGTLFIKFHTSDRANLEKRIRARWKYNYHREDVRAKEAVHEEKQQVFVQTKKKKKEIWKASKEERKAAFEAVRRENERRLKETSPLPYSPSPIKRLKITIGEYLKREGKGSKTKI